MKASILLETTSPLLERETGEIMALLEPVQEMISSLELVLYGGEPGSIPNLGSKVERIVAICTQEQPCQEEILYHLVSYYSDIKPDILIFDSDQRAGALAARLAFRLGGTSLLQVEKLNLEADRVIALRAVYGNNLMAKIRLERAPYCLTPARIGSKKIDYHKHPPEIERYHCEEVATPHIISQEAKEIFQDERLQDSPLVLAVGNGVTSKDDLANVSQVAADLGFDLAASRPVVMAGLMGMERLVGVSGAVVSPKICLAAGVSGAGAFVYGIENSELVIAVNRDPLAPIFRHADVGLVADLQDFLLELRAIAFKEEDGDE